VGVDALSGELKVDLETMSWSAAESVQRVAHPSIPAGNDPVSLMLSNYLPGLVDGANDKVAAAEAEDQKFAGKVSSARSAYQSGDEAGGQAIQKAGESLNPASAAGKAGGADGGIGQFGQMMGMAMQAFQAPAQAMQALGSVPQTAMQAAQQIGQQVQQLAGQAGKDGGKPGEGGAGAGGVGGAASQQLKPEDRKPGEEKAREEKRDEKPEEKKAPEADKKHAAAGPSSGPSAPVPPSTPAPRSGRHAADPAVDV